MHPALRQHVAPASIHTGRYIAVGALTGFAGILFMVAILRLADSRAETAIQARLDRGLEELGRTMRPSRSANALNTLAAIDREALEEVHQAAERYAYLAYPTWVASNPDRACPSGLSELDELVPGLSVFDPWHGEYRFECNGHRLTVSSSGPDRVFGTSDDIRGNP